MLLNEVSALHLRGVKTPLSQRDSEAEQEAAVASCLFSTPQSHLHRKCCAAQDGGWVLMGIGKNQGLIPQVPVAVFQRELHKTQMSSFLFGKRWSEAEEVQSNSGCDCPRQNSSHRCIC